MKRKELLKEIRGQSVAELRARVRTVSQELMKLRFRQATGQLQQAHRLGILRRERAKILTVLKQAPKK